MSLFANHGLKRNLLKAIACAAPCAAFPLLATLAYGQSAGAPQFSDPYGGVAAYLDGAPSKPPDAAKPAAKLISKSKIAAKKPPVSASVLDAATWTLADPSLAAGPAPAAPSLATHAPAADSALGFGLKWYGENAPYYNAGTSTISGVDEIKRDSNGLLGEPSSTGNGVEAGVNLKF